MAAAITPDPSLQISEQIADFFEFLLNEQREPVPRLSPIQILATSVRQGMSSEILASNIISRFNEAGIPNGTLGSGTANSMEILVNIIAQEVIIHFQKYARVDTAILPGISIEANGGNGAGPVISEGASTSTGSGQATIN